MSTRNKKKGNNIIITGITIFLYILYCNYYCNGSKQPYRKKSFCLFLAFLFVSEEEDNFTSVCACICVFLVVILFSGEVIITKNGLACVFWFGSTIIIKKVYMYVS